MWQDKRANIILPGQTSFPPGAHVGNIILPPTSGSFESDFVSGPSRKRKSIHLDPDPSKSPPEYSFPWKSNLRDDSTLLGSNRQVNDQGVYSNQAKSVGRVNYAHHYDNQDYYDFSEPSCFPTSHRNGVKKIGNASYNVPSQSLELNGIMPVGDTQLPPIWQTQPSYVVSQTEVHRSMPLLNTSNARSEALQGSFGTMNYVMPEKMPRDMASSDSRRPTGTLPQSFVQPGGFSDILIGQKESVFCTESGGVNDLENVREVLGASVYIQQDGKIRLLEKEEQYRGAPSGQCFVDNSESKERSSAEKRVALMESTSESRSSVDDTAGQGQKNNLNSGHLKSDEKTRLHSEKPACTVAEKLWDGSIQLSSSVTLSAIAFFKSGEKLLDINWPEFIEVKGKVRLEAFEKYIQDLPRSRNRGLMVISLCWKEGTSVTGLNGLKEVARGYKKGAKVGFAQISSGTDLYICPRTDTIITILAKHGYFKGMSVIDDYLDSLIGCVVWKKNRPSSNPTGEKTDSKISSSLKKVSPISQTQESAAKLENGTKNGSDSKNIDSSFLSVPSVLPINTTPVSVGQQTPNNSYSPIVSSDPHPFNSVKEQVLPVEDDDLPEYDFGVACGISLPPRPPPPVSKPLQPALPRSSENSCLTRIPSDSHLHVVSMSEEKLNTSEVSSQELTKKKKLFDDDDDDDDMPEWCPPEHHSQSQAGNITPPTTNNLPLRPPLPSIRPPTPIDTRSTFDMPEWCPPEHHSQSQPETIKPPITSNLPSRPPLPPIRPPTPTDTRSSFSYQPFRPAFSSPPSSIRPTQPLPLESSPSSSTGFPRPPIRPELPLQSGSSLPRPAIRPEFQLSDRRQKMP